MQYTRIATSKNIEETFRGSSAGRAVDCKRNCSFLRKLRSKNKVNCWKSYELFKGQSAAKPRKSRKVQRLSRKGVVLKFNTKRLAPKLVERQTWR